MIAVETSGWAGAEVALSTYDSDGTWAFNARIGGDVADVVTVLEDIAAFVVSDLFVDPHTVTVEAVDAGDGRLRFQLRVGPDEGWASVDCNAIAAAKLGWPAAYTEAVGYLLPLLADVTSAPATAAAQVHTVENWTRWNKARGPRWGLGAPTADLRRPAVGGFMTEVQTVALADALDAAEVPRRARIYDPAARVWRLVTLGEATVAPADEVLYSVDLAVLG